MDAKDLSRPKRPLDASSLVNAWVGCFDSTVPRRERAERENRQSPTKHAPNDGRRCADLVLIVMLAAGPGSIFPNASDTSALGRAMEHYGTKEDAQS